MKKGDIVICSKQEGFNFRVIELTVGPEPGYDLGLAASKHKINPSETILGAILPLIYYLLNFVYCFAVYYIIKK